jgi:hypothetical protein
MKIKAILMASLFVLPVAFAACEASTDSDVIVTDSYQCTATTSNVYQGCLTFREELCSRFVDCGTYSDMTTCEAWFDGADGFEGCDAAATDAIYSASAYQNCICAVPDAVCVTLGAGVLTALPACGEWAYAP